MPAELVLGAVPMRPDSGPQSLGLLDQLLTRHGCEVVVHHISYASNGDGVLECRAFRCSG